MLDNFQDIEEVYKIIVFQTGASVEEIAKAIGYTRPHLTPYLKGEGSEKVRPDILEKLKNAYKGDILQFVLKYDYRGIPAYPEIPELEGVESDLESRLRLQNEYLKTQLELSLGELRHRSLLNLAISETTQNLVIELLAKQRKMSWEEVAVEVGKLNGEKYQKLKEEGNFAYVGK